MLTPAFSTANQLIWEAMPADTNGVESLNKCSIEKSNRAKTLESCLDFTYRQDKKMTLEHFFTLQKLWCENHTKFGMKHWLLLSH